MTNGQSGEETQNSEQAAAEDQNTKIKTEPSAQEALVLGQQRILANDNDSPPPSTDSQRSSGWDDGGEYQFHIDESLGQRAPSGILPSIEKGGELVLALEAPSTIGNPNAGVGGDHAAIGYTGPDVASPTRESIHRFSPDVIESLLDKLEAEIKSHKGSQNIVQAPQCHSVRPEEEIDNSAVPRFIPEYSDLVLHQHDGRRKEINTVSYSDEGSKPLGVRLYPQAAALKKTTNGYMRHGARWKRDAAPSPDDQEHRNNNESRSNRAPMYHRINPPKSYRRQATKVEGSIDQAILAGREDLASCRI